MGLEEDLKIAERKTKATMSFGTYRILILLFIAGAMTTCLSLYISSSTRKFATEFTSRNNPQLRLRHSFESTTTHTPNLDFRLVIHGMITFFSSVQIFLDYPEFSHS